MDRCLPKGNIKVGADVVCTRGEVAAATELETEAFSAASGGFNCFNLSKYRGDANSVRWRGSIMFCVWPLCHPVAVELE